jgi:hypothetical protein
MFTQITVNAESPYSVIEWRGREKEREKKGLKLLYQLMEKSQYFSNPNFNKLISSFFCIMAKPYVASLNEKVKVIEAKEKDKLSVQEI